jgi:hypothetical protein
VPTCKQVCVSCPANTHSVMVAGACCPSCVPNTQLSCAAGKMQYETARAQMVDKYSHGCNADSDCVVVTVSNECEGCQSAALWSVVASDFTSNTASAAQVDCASCPPALIPPCLPQPGYAVCVSNICELAIPI